MSEREGPDGRLAIRAESISKVYRLYDRPFDRLRELLFRAPRHRPFHALKDVSFELPAGGALGLIGENGAGKSTLLKIVAGTTRATSGSIERHGVIASILELGMGFHPEFTGRENARMNAAILGLSGADIRRRLPQIRDFAELGDFFDRPVRTYSSGMALRLAFAVATHADADVLIVDEALAVGDGYFQKKSVDRITDFQKRGGTLLFCSHALYYVALLCDRAIWLKQGDVASAGPALAVVRAYEAFLQRKEQERAVAERSQAAPAAAATTQGRRPARFTEVLVHDGSGFPRAEFGSGETVAVDLAFESDDPSLAFHLRVGADREDGVQAFAVDTRSEPFAPLTGRHVYRLRLVFPQLPIAQGDFRLYAFLGDETALHLHDLKVLHPGFSIVSPDYTVGLVKPHHFWTVTQASPEEPLPLTAGSSVASS
ncbi:MAG TPA: ABC transporter ATP-binding protein [Thermoanaerobaculia bacterium]|nr:ABC transporter ATP-binding protein [Thermoanaerobaculia bacterium]